MAVDQARQDRPRGSGRSSGRRPGSSPRPGWTAVIRSPRTSTTWSRRTSPRSTSTSRPARMAMRAGSCAARRGRHRRGGPGQSVTTRRAPTSASAWRLLRCAEGETRRPAPGGAGRRIYAARSEWGDCADRLLPLLGRLHLHLRHVHFLLLGRDLRHGDACPSRCRSPRSASGPYRWWCRRWASAPRTRPSPVFLQAPVMTSAAIPAASVSFRTNDLPVSRDGLCDCGARIWRAQASPGLCARSPRGSLVEPGPELFLTQCRNC